MVAYCMLSRLSFYKVQRQISSSRYIDTSRPSQKRSYLIMAKVQHRSLRRLVQTNIQCEPQLGFLSASSRVEEGVSKRICVAEIPPAMFWYLKTSPETIVWGWQNCTACETDHPVSRLQDTRPSSAPLSLGTQHQSYEFHSFIGPVATIYSFFCGILSYVCFTIITPPPLVLLMSCTWLYLTGSFFFDIVHSLFHQCSKSRHRLLRRVGYLHQVHHLYFNRNLKFNNKYHWLNLCIELPLELSCQLFGTWLGWLAADHLRLTGNELLSQELFILVLWFEVARAIVVAILDGRDSNHKSYTNPPKDPNWLLVGPQYHALHHIDPAAYISSTFRLFDWIFGTGYSLKSRRITITSRSGAFCSVMKRQLQNEGVKCIQELKFGVNWKHDDYGSMIPILADTDVLILTHGSKGDDALKSHCELTLQMIELFKKHHKPKPDQKMLLPEVWYLESEIGMHPSLGQEASFLPYARTLYDDPTILYRHIVPSVCQSPMGSAIVSAEWTARITMWWIRRGARYVPVTYTGLAYLNYFKFMYWVKKA